MAIGESGLQPLHRAQEAVLNVQGPTPPPPPGESQQSAAPTWDTGDQNHTQERSGSASSHLALIATGSNAAVLGAHEIHRYQTRSNSLDKEPPAGLKPLNGKPNQFRANLITTLEQTNTHRQGLTGQNEPLKKFLTGKGELSKQQIHDSMNRDHEALTSSARSYRSSASTDDAFALSAAARALTETDTLNDKGEVIESAGTKAASDLAQAAMYRASANRSRELAAELEAKAEKVANYLDHGGVSRTSVMEQSIGRDVARTDESIQTLVAKGRSLETGIRREPFYENFGHVAGRVGVQVISVAGAGLEGYEAFRQAQKGNTGSAIAHGVAAAGNAMMGGGALFRSPEAGIAGMVLGTTGAIVGEALSSK